MVIGDLAIPCICCHTALWSTGFHELPCVYETSKANWHSRMNLSYKIQSLRVKVKFSHTRYRALGPELIPVHRQSARRWREVNHAIDLAVGCITFCQACGYLRSFHQMALPVNGNTIWFQLYYSFVDPERMKGWVGLVGWPVADGLSTLVVTHQLQVERRTGKVRQSFYHCTTPPTSHLE